MTPTTLAGLLADWAARTREKIVPTPLFTTVAEPLERETLDDYLARHGIEHFTAQEIRTCRRIRTLAPEPKRSWWPRIVPTLWLAETLRTRMGHALVVGNGYRPPKLNRAVGGAANSQHLYFRAVDLDLPRAWDSRDNRRLFYREAVALHLELGRDYKMGLGLYASGSRLHIDTGWRFRFWKPKYYLPIRESMR